jgi:hypothetical protein
MLKLFSRLSVVLMEYFLVIQNKAGKMNRKVIEKFDKNVTKTRKNKRRRTEQLKFLKQK